MKMRELPVTRLDVASVVCVMTWCVAASWMENYVASALCVLLAISLIISAMNGAVRDMNGDLAMKALAGWMRSAEARIKLLQDAEPRGESAGVSMIAGERARQKREENWSEEHDDEHSDSELARAAAAYSLPEWLRQARSRQMCSDSEFTLLGKIWPWDSKWWKPTPDDRVRELTKAGALIAAEIDRLLRASEKGRK